MANNAKQQDAMSTFPWGDSRLTLEEHTVQVAGGHQLQLRRCYKASYKENDRRGVPVFLVAGFGQDSSIFLPESTQAGLAPYLASCGYDVFVAELRGKGRSWPHVTRHADWGLHELITEDIPAHLNTLAKLRPGEPQIWVGHGLGSLLLLGCYARLDITPAPLLGMVHFAAGRCCQLTSLDKTLRYMTWQWGCETSAALFGCVNATGLGHQVHADSRKVYQQWRHWQQSINWLDPDDQFDYRVALQRKALPASLYFSLRDSGLWGSAEDTRLLLKELGTHDARLVGLGKAQGNHRNYTAQSLLTHHDAVRDHFETLKDWLDELQNPADQDTLKLA